MSLKTLLQFLILRIRKSYFMTLVPHISSQKPVILISHRNAFVPRYSQYFLFLISSPCNPRIDMMDILSVLVSIRFSE